MCVPCLGVESITVALIYARAGTELGGAALKLQTNEHSRRLRLGLRFTITEKVENSAKQVLYTVSRLKIGTPMQKTRLL